MLDLVKFTWRNAHGYWIPVEWVLVTTDSTEERVKSRASLGRPSMTDFKILDRATVPEEIRLTGRAEWLRAQIILYDKGADDYTAAEFLDAMVAVTA